MSSPQTMQRSNARAALRRTPSGGAPFVFDWRRGIVYLIDPIDSEWESVKPVTVYRARVSPETIINVMPRISKSGKPIPSSWAWTIIHVSPIAFHVDGGNEGTLAAGKRRAEFAARPFTQQTPIWEDDDAESGATGEAGEPLPF